MIRLGYTGTAPGADAETYVLFSTVAAGLPSGVCYQMGISGYRADIEHSGAGTLRLSKSSDGITWYSVAEQEATPSETGTTQVDWRVELFDHWKVEWVNGGAAQDPWAVDQQLGGGGIATSGPTVPPLVVLWEDTFQRDPGPPGNDWQHYGDILNMHEIADHMLLRHGTWSESRSGHLVGGTLPADYYVEVETTSDLFSKARIGLAGRFEPFGTCVKLFLFTPWDVRAGTGWSYNENEATISVTGGIPDSWFSSDNHTLGLGFVGDEVTLYLDRVAYGTVTLATNNKDGTGFAIIGDGYDLSWTRASVYEGMVAPVDPPEPYIEFRTTGATFSPLIETAAGATIEWLAPGGLTSTSKTPTFNFGSGATRYVRLRVTPMSALTMVNIGYGHDDGGPITIPDHPTQAVNRVTGLANAPNLTVFACRACPLTAIDVTGCHNLVNLEAYTCGSLASVVGIEDLSSCQRFVVEGSAIATKLDLTGMPELRDLRARTNQAVFTLVDWGDPAVGHEHVWHICTGAHPMSMSTMDYSSFVALKEYWVPEAPGMTGTLTFTAANVALDSIDCHDDEFTALVLTNAFSAGRNASVNLTNNPVTSVDVSGCPGLAWLTLTGAALPQAEVDEILVTMNAYGNNGGGIYLDGGTNAVPSSAGLAAVAALQARGCDVRVNS